MVLYRLITFLRASPNNESGSMFSAFGDAVNEFGLPSKARGGYSYRLRTNTRDRGQKF